MAASLDEVVKLASKKYAKSQEIQYSYGTAGIRTKAELLTPAMYRMGLLAALRSLYKKGAVGVMITASHNPECDNGVKLIDPMGEMMEQDWEVYATELANVDDAGVAQMLERIGAAVGVVVPHNAGGEDDECCKVLFGRDTRQSSAALEAAAMEGVIAMGLDVQSYGLLTTPQLHYIVRCVNDPTYGTASEQGYYEKIANGFLRLSRLAPGPAKSRYKPLVRIDGANGVGAIKMAVLAPLLLPSGLAFEVVNDGSTGKLNHMCGADYVKIAQSCPDGICMEPAGVRCLSFDGDADRVVYFFARPNPIAGDSTSGSGFEILDGDRIATLIAGYIRSLLDAMGGMDDVAMVLVQTAYANGASTKYIQDVLKVPVVCVPTGVKHLHHAATKSDIGVYFEANGHGTVLFSAKVEDRICAAENDQNRTIEERSAAAQLAAFIDICNQTIGDAISDMLMVESILRARGDDVLEWSMSYKDLPNRQLKVKVSDRSVIRTADAERRCVAPVDLQPAIDLLVKQYGPSARAFIRPSGTEDIVRVYAEAETREGTGALAEAVALKVFQLAGGVGEPPKCT